MDVRFTEEQDLLRKSARDFLSRECGMPRVREWMEQPQGFAETVWERIAALGWTGLAAAECHGGAGLGALELGIVLEEIGRAAAPGPFFASVVLGAGAIEVAGSASQRNAWLPPLVAGSERASVAWLDTGGPWDVEGITLPARADGDGLRLDGEKRLVPEAHACDWLLVAVRLAGPPGPDGVRLVRVSTRAPGVEVRPMAYTDLTRRVAAVRFADVAVPAGDVLPGDGAALERLLDRARVAVCADLCGVAAAALERAVAFAGAREQFGRPIGSFQAIQHRCADMLVRVEGMRSASYRAAWALAADEPDAHVAACMAKGYCSDAASRVTGDCIQVHGGLGFTWEQDPQVYYKRAKAGELLLGDGAWHREQVARALWGPPAPSR